MAVISITVPDAMLPRVVTALTAAGGYSATLPDGTPNPQTPAQFAKAMVAAYVKQVVKTYEAEQSAATNNIDVT